MATMIGRMNIPGNGIYVVQGEMSMLMTAMKKVNRWSSHNHQDEENDILIKSFIDLKDVLNQIGDLRELDPNSFLSPFLEVVRSEETTGPVTSIALSSVNKFLSYGLIDPNCKSIAPTIENIADAVNHAKFVGTDQTSDAIVLMKILQVLRTLMLSPQGAWLTNESVCEILLSCFRISFEVRLNELLRRCAENCLRDMVQLIFTRLPTFAEDLQRNNNIKQKLKIQSGAIEASRGKRKNKIQSKLRPNKEDEKASTEKSKDHTSTSLRVKENSSDILDMQGTIHNDSIKSHFSPVDSNPVSPLNSPECDVVPNFSSNEGQTMPHVETPKYEPEIIQHSCSDVVVISIEDSSSNSGDPQEKPLDPIILPEEEEKLKGCESELPNNLPNETRQSLDEYIEPLSPINVNNSQVDLQEWVNQQGVRFTASDQEEVSLPGPYGLVSVHELLRFLASLCNPQDKQNSDFMVHMGLTLITIALEVGADNIAKYPSLMTIVKDDICRNLFSLLNSERYAVFAAVLQVCFLLFESLRTHLKFQLEHYLLRLIEIIVSDSSKASYEHREIALEFLVQLWRIPGFVTELYLNYDCALYCPNLYEELINLLSKNAFPVSGIYNTHLLSLDALLTVIDSIESHCNSRILQERQIPHKEDIENYSINNSNYIVRTGTRQKLSSNIPSHEHLMAVKRKKKLLSTGTEHFNLKPKKGISFLQEHNLLSNPLDPNEVVSFLRENPHLDKKMIGEYISNRANLSVLDCFVKSFDFTDLRIDEALRIYLETFRLPGESPLIALVMEHFAEHWHSGNGRPFANADVAFTLAYAVIMLNVDQHNYNVKRQNNPMTAEDFKRNLKKVNGDKDFEEEMLDEIYNSIKNDEIVMPAEQTGVVKENYLWKVLLRRGNSKDGEYVHAPNGLLDHDLFSLIWGPTVTALSSLFDKATDPTIYQKAIFGFRKCAMISAHYGMSNDFDNLIISLCKFTTLHYQAESHEILTIMFGENPKARLAAKTVFNLAHRHGDIIRDSWRNILDCILHLYKCKLLPKILVEAEDFIELSGKISLIREEIQLHPKTESSLFSSLYSYMLLGSEQTTQKGPSPEDQEAMRVAQNSIRECNLEQLITESKFLRIDSLQFFIKALVTASYGPEGHVSLGSSYSEDTAIFFLEFLLKVVIQNKDRIGPMWLTIKEHIYTLLMGAAACDHHFLVERSVVGLIRLAIRLMHREELSAMVLQSLRMLLLLKSSTLSRVARQVSYGMFELLKSCAANIHSATDWAIIFTLLECVGAGAPPPRVVSKPLNDSGARSDGEIQIDSGLGNERGYTSDSELSKAGSLPLSPTNSSEIPTNTPTGWILVGREGEIQPVSLGGRVLPHDFTLKDKDFMPHDPYAMIKCCESLAFLVRDVVHITPYNFQNCVHCLRTFVEASADATERKCSKKAKDHGQTQAGKSRKKATIKKKEERARSPTLSAYDADESDPEDAPGYQQVCLQLLDLMHTIHIRTAQIFKWWAEETSETEHISLWQHAWCPLLQGIGRLCSHPNRQIRMSAITYLQRALLVPDLQNLNGEEWELCFTHVLFPLLSKLLDPIPASDGLEETRIRAATVLSKVFLHHLTQLQTLATFSKLWLHILDFMDKYMHADNSDLLLEAIPESLKNLLLVMDSANVFSDENGRNEIWNVTWDKINSYLPNLYSELFKVENPEKSKEQMNMNKEQNMLAESPPISTSVSSSHILSTEPLYFQPALGSEEVIEPPISLISPQNWQPPAPIFPHLGQPISTPIGPSISPQVSSSVPSKPVLSPHIGNHNISMYPSVPGFTQHPGSHIFYQQVNQPQNQGPQILQPVENIQIPLSAITTILPPS